MEITTFKDKSHILPVLNFGHSDFHLMQTQFFLDY